MNQTVPTVAIVGAGPAGCALACFLRQRGADVLVFDSGKDPDLLVGESLIPAAIPLLRRLGIEDRVREVSVLKPGASLLHVDGIRLDFPFRSFGRSLRNPFRRKTPDYAYNIPRPVFDRIVREQAKCLGVRFIAQRAGVLAINDDTTYELRLAASSLDAAGLTDQQQPDLLIDATGRTRLFARSLDIAAVCGNRDDVAYFAHYDRFGPKTTQSGQVLITVLNRGWSWRIPLRDCVSVGVVMDKRCARHYGDSAEARLDAMIAEEPGLSRNAQQAKRITPVRSYRNYQLVHQRGYGPGWAMVGDAFGFVDPMLSPGVFMALESASLLDKHIHLNGQRIERLDLKGYSRELNHWHNAWKEVIEYLYDGRLLQLCQAGNTINEHAGRYAYTRFLEWYYRRLIGQLVSGVGTQSTFNRKMLQAGSHYLTDLTEDTERLSVAGG